MILASTSSTRARILEGFGVEFCQVDSGFDEEGLFEELLDRARKRARDFIDRDKDFVLQGRVCLDFCPSKNLSSKTLEHIKNLIGENIDGYLALNPKQIAWECAKGKLESALKKIAQNDFALSEDLRQKNMQEVLKEGILACDSVVVVHLPHATHFGQSPTAKSATTSTHNLTSTQNLHFRLGVDFGAYHTRGQNTNDTRDKDTKKRDCTNLLLRKAKTPTQARIMLELQSGNPISIITAVVYQSHKGFFCNIDCAEFLLDEFCQDDIECYVKSSLWQGSVGCVKVEGFHKGYILSQKGLESCALGLGFERILPFLGII